MRSHVKFMQLRMSKKIAQLTKVIYHLNSKTEDHEQELQEMTEQYESEIEQILKDTTEKINFFKAQMEDARDERHLHEVAKVNHEHIQPPHVYAYHTIHQGSDVSIRHLQWLYPCSFCCLRARLLTHNRYSLS
jgi:hypothetical protein